MASFHFRPAAVLFLLWLGITALDFNKAFHIDDTFHLKAAQQLEAHPGKPMTGLVHWGYDPEPMHEFNQPPGFFYLVAATGHVFGYREAPMHAMRSLFTLLALLCMYRLARYRSPRHAVLLTALMALCPAFMVNQGLMTDVPLMAMVLLFASLLLVPGHGSRWWRYTLAALALSGALMIKYSALPLLVVFGLALVLRGQRRMLPLLMIPVAVVAAWSAWNLHEYGSIHILDREAGDSTWRGVFVRNLALFTALGAVSPFTPAFLGAFTGRLPRWALGAWLGLAAAGAVFAVAVWTGLIGEPASDMVLRLVFTLNGVLIMLYAIRYLPRTLSVQVADEWILAAWAFGVALFIVLFSPMMATRHLLLLLPPLLLLLAPALDRTYRPVRWMAVACTGLLGLALTLSDKAYADFYRRHAPLIAAQMAPLTHGTVWSVGHWGWQWYAEQAGMSSYGTYTSPVAVGDILVIPQDHDAQPLLPGLAVEPLATWAATPHLATFVNVENYAGMYTSGYEKLPWTLTRTNRKVIEAFRVAAVP